MASVPRRTSLARHGRSIRVALVALAAMTNACTLPRVQPRMAPDFAQGRIPVREVAILPVDLGLQVKGRRGGLRPDPVLSRQVIHQVNQGLAAALHRRGYNVGAIVRPDGSVKDDDAQGATTQRLVIHPADLSALRVEIHDATSFQGPGPGAIEVTVDSALTGQLGQATGTDASFYARGWVYVDPTASGSGRTAAKIIGVTLLAVFIVGVILMLAAGGKGGGGNLLKGAGRALATTGRAVARSAAVLGEVAVRSLPHLLDAVARAKVARPHGGIPCHRCRAPLSAHEGEPRPFFGDPPRALPAPPVSPESAARPDAAAQGPRLRMQTGPRALVRSTVGIAMTLVHNPSGRVLWHAGQRFEVEARRPGKVERLIQHFLKELPLAAAR